MELPNYIFHKKFSNFLWLHNESIISEGDNIYQTQFCDFIWECQATTNVIISNSNVKNHKTIDYKYHKTLIREYQLINDIENLVSITESPDIHLVSPKLLWEYYSNSIYNVSILAFEIDLKPLVFKFLKCTECVDYQYNDINDFYNKNKLMFMNNNEFINHLKINYPCS